MPLTGLYTALVTPFVKGKFSLPDFRNLLRLQVEGKVDGVVVGGTTGEALALTIEEFTTMINAAVAESGSVRVFAGVGSYDPAKAVEKTRLAHDLGVDGMLDVTPFYNKPTQSGLVEYYERIADSTDRPIILYSVPSRTGVEIAIDTVVKLRKGHGNIVAIKEATENCSRIETMGRIFDGDDFSLLSGNDSMTLPFMSLGAVGVVSVISNLMPSKMSKFIALANGGDFHGALGLYREMCPVIGKLFLETNPLPIKFLLKFSGIISSAECRPPLGELGEKSVAELANLLAQGQDS
jgi:4-hydroxy-tetrahydrodipicolinate synthase